jgi:hypothetical protein
MHHQLGAEDRSALAAHWPARAGNVGGATAIASSD